MSFKLEPIGNEKIERVREWLRGLKFDTFLGVEDAPLLQNPFRNGVLLCELVSLFKGEEIHGIAYVTSHITQARSNVELALREIGTLKDSRQQPLLHYSLLRVKEDILKGDKDAIWGVLGALYAHSPCHLKAPNTYANYCDPTLHETLPYSREDLYKLEKSLVAWLTAEFYPGKGERLVDFEDEIRNATLFAKIAETILGIKICGLTREPKTLTSCIHNMRKALDPLRRCPKMSQRFLWDEKAVVCKMHRGIIFGLL